MFMLLPSVEVCCWPFLTSSCAKVTPQQVLKQTVAQQLRRTAELLREHSSMAGVDMNYVEDLVGSLLYTVNSERHTMRAMLATITL
jgi:hypothetical protein